MWKEGRHPLFGAPLASLLPSPQSSPPNPAPALFASLVSRWSHLPSWCQPPPWQVTTKPTSLVCILHPADRLDFLDVQLPSHTQYSWLWTHHPQLQLPLLPSRLLLMARLSIQPFRQQLPWGSSPKLFQPQTYLITAYSVFQESSAHTFIPTHWRECRGLRVSILRGKQAHWHMYQAGTEAEKLARVDLGFSLNKGVNSAP